MRVIPTICLWALAAVAAAQSFDPRAYVERAGALIEAGQNGLGRTYLEPALIDYRLSPAERSRAYYLRGYSFFADGMYVSAAKDYNRALEFNAGNPVVLSAVAHLYMEGLGVEANPALGVGFLEQAAQADHAPAEMRLGVAYLRGVGVDPDLEAAREWLSRAADAGLAQAMVYLAQSFRAPFADPPDLQQARRWFEKAQEAGSADARAYLGFMAEAGEGAPADAGAARRYFTQAAEAGSAVAQAKLGHIYLTGDGVAADPATARQWFEQAAEAGHPTGMMGLAYLYDTGTGVAQDGAQALDWYRRAAEAGTLEAQLRMAYAGLRQGDLAGQREAATWLAAAAEHNDPQALNDYAWLLATSAFEQMRNGAQATTLAMQAVSRDGKSAAYLDTLAAAYAEAGKFDRAVTTQEQALALVPADQPELAAELRQRLEQFQHGEPWRE